MVIYTDKELEVAKDFLSRLEKHIFSDVDMDIFSALDDVLDEISKENDSIHLVQELATTLCDFKYTTACSQCSQLNTCRQYRMAKKAIKAGYRKVNEPGTVAINGEVFVVTPDVLAKLLDVLNGD